MSDTSWPTLAPTEVSSPLPTLELVLEDDYYLWVDTPSDLSDAQQKALALIPLLTGLLSAWGSLNIIWMVCGIDKRSRNCYNRIMLGLSCSDLTSSLILGLQAFLLPRDSSTRLWAFGNDATCTAMGFFQQLSLCSALYSGMLSWMYLLMIRYSVPEDKLSKRYEPWMHVISVGFPIASAILGVAMGLFKEVAIGPFCWFAGPPPSVLVAYLVGGFPLFATMIAVVVNNLLVYCHLRRTIPTDNSSSVSDHQHPKSTRASSVGSSDGAPSEFSNEHGTWDYEVQRREQREKQREEQRLRQLQSRRNSNLQDVAIQGFLYVGVFMITYLPLVLLRVVSAQLSLQRYEESKVYWLMIVQAIFWPMQGLFNFLIYSRSPTSYLREIE